MKKHIAILILALACGIAVQAQEIPTAASPINFNDTVPTDPSVRIGRLDNGFTYFLRANKIPENSIHLRLVVNAGSILEDESQRGLAHFCEHMAFNGIEGLPHNQLNDTLQKYGLEFGRAFNASTGFDRTHYYIEMPADNPELLELGLFILDGWSHGLLFDPQELEDERGVIHEEWRESLGANYRLLKATWPIVYKGSRYVNRLPIGEESVIMGFKRDDIVRFYNDWYRPDLQAVVIVGDIADMDALETRVRELFGKRPKAVNPRPRPQYFKIPDNKKPLIAIATDKEATNTYLTMSWKHDNLRDSTIGDTRHSLMHTLTSYLIRDRFTELAEDPSAPFTQAAAEFGWTIGRGNYSFSAYALPKGNRAAEATETMLREIYRAVQHGFTQAELDQQKEHMVYIRHMFVKSANINQNSNLAQRYASYYLEGGTLPSLEWTDSIATTLMPSITLEDCNNLFRSWVTDNNFTYQLTAPDSVAVPTQKEVVKLLKKMRNGKYPAWSNGSNDEPFWGKVLPEVTSLASRADTGTIGFTEYTCPNGIRFLVKRTDYQPGEILIVSEGKGGSSLYEDEEAYVAELAADIVGRAGSGSYNSTQLKKYLNGKICGVYPSIYNTGQHISGNTDTRYLETFLQQVSLLYEAPRKDADHFAKFMEEKRNQCRFASQDPMQLLKQALHDTSYPNDKRNVVIPTQEQLDHVTLDRTYEIFRERFCDASNQAYVFVGDLGDEEIKLIAKYLNNLPVNGKQKDETWKKRPHEFAKGIRHATVVKGTDNQGALRIYGETVSTEYTPKDAMIANQLSDCLQITVTEIIREKMGGSYSPQAGFSASGGVDTTFTWYFYIDCDPAQEQGLETAVLDILKDYVSNGPDPVTLGKVQEQMLVKNSTDRQTNIYWVGVLLSILGDNEEREQYLDSHYEELVRSITADDIKALAKKYINLDNYVVVTLKPETAIAQ